MSAESDCSWKREVRGVDQSFDLKLGGGEARTLSLTGLAINTDEHIYQLSLSFTDTHALYMIPLVTPKKTESKRSRGKSLISRVERKQEGLDGMSKVSNALTYVSHAIIILFSSLKFRNEARGKEGEVRLSNLRHVT